jgi:hypothetical protein
MMRIKNNGTFWKVCSDVKRELNDDKRKQVKHKSSAKITLETSCVNIF